MQEFHKIYSVIFVKYVDNIRDQWYNDVRRSEYYGTNVNAGFDKMER